MGEIYRVLYKRSENPENDIKSLILKIAPKDSISTDKDKIRDMFLREVLMYDQVRFVNFRIIDGT